MALDSQAPIPDFTFKPYRLGCLGAVILAPVAADQFGPLAYLGMLLLVLPLLFLEQKPNVPKTLAILAVGSLLSLSTVLVFGLSDLGRFSLLIEFIGLAFLLPRR